MIETSPRQELVFENTESVCPKATVIAAQSSTTAMPSASQICWTIQKRPLRQTSVFDRRDT